MAQQLNKYTTPMRYDKPVQRPIKVSNLPKYKKELMGVIAKQSRLMLKDIFPHLTERDYEIAAYTYNHPGNLQIYFNEKFVVDLVVSGDFPRIDAINNVIYPADKPNITYDNVSYIMSKLFELRTNTYKGDGLYAAHIGFNPTFGFLRVVASDGTRYHQKQGASDGNYKIQ